MSEGGSAGVKEVRRAGVLLLVLHGVGDALIMVTVPDLHVIVFLGVVGAAEGRGVGMLRVAECKAAGRWRVPARRCGLRVSRGISRVDERYIHLSSPARTAPWRV